MLASAPIRLSNLVGNVGDQTTVERMLDIGEEAQFAKRLDMDDGIDSSGLLFAATSSRRL